MLPEPQTFIRVFVTCSLGGLLLAVGLRLRWREVSSALRSCRIAVIALANFLLVPALALVTARVAQLSPDLSAGMLLLAAAPFAPVVPVFTRMARADLPLAAGLTSFFPVLCAVLTPLVLQIGLPWLGGTASVQFRPAVILGILLATITLPLAAGIALNHAWPGLAGRVLRPLEIASETMGALSLLLVAAIEFPSIIGTPWPSALALIVFVEGSFLLGYAFGGPAPARRAVVAFGTGNRNLALALLVAVDAFAGTAIPGAVVTIGLLGILAGLVHVGYHRFFGFGATVRAADRT